MFALLLICQQKFRAQGHFKNGVSSCFGWCLASCLVVALFSLASCSWFNRVSGQSFPTNDNAAPSLVRPVQPDHEILANSEILKNDSEISSTQNAPPRSVTMAVRHAYTPLARGDESTLGLYENSFGASTNIDVEPTVLSAEDEYAAAAAPQEMRCLAENNSKFAYRKRVAVLPIELQSRTQAVDLPLIERDYTQALAERLVEAGLLAIEASAHYRLQQYPERSRLQSIPSQEQMRSIAKALNTQFIVTGRLEDLSFDKTKVNAIKLFTGFSSWKKLANRTYEGATNSYSRQLNIVIDIYDGPTGVLINQQRYRGRANHKIDTRYNYGFDSNIFWQSDFGELVAETLDQQAQFISQSLECLPMRAKVLRVAEDIIEIDAGREAMLMPGDRLRIFHREPGERNLKGELQYRWRFYGGVTVLGVFPSKAIAKPDLDPVSDRIQVGDIVQAW